MSTQPSAEQSIDELDKVLYFVYAHTLAGHESIPIINEAKAQLQKLLIRERIEERCSVRWLPDEGKWVEQEADRIAQLTKQLEGDE